MHNKLTLQNNMTKSFNMKQKKIFQSVKGYLLKTNKKRYKNKLCSKKKRSNKINSIHFNQK